MQCKRWLGLGLVAAYGAAMTVHEVVWLYRYGPLVYFSSQLYGLDPIRLRVPPNMIAFAAILDFTAFNVTVLVPAVCIVHFVSVCDLIVLKVMLLQEDIANGQMAFTGWNCFDIDRPFVLTVMGAVITYSVVLQQLT
ncbi:hypothetical protein V5799_029090 [Amblyomma americanum]|uniref:Uncharacterized protein n=1 Tax=Amblyomma americanum TaxID=6943 RepID=A0AAQ4ES13_AMBAM